VKLPRSPNVDEILSKYLEFKTKKDGMWVFYSNTEFDIFESFPKSNDTKFCVSVFVQGNWFGRWNIERHKELFRQGIASDAPI